MKTRLSKIIGQWLLIGSMGLVMTGCAWSVGGKKGETTVIEPTKGEQLIDLQKAHKSGAISDAEYDKLKAEIVGK